MAAPYLRHLLRRRLSLAAQPLPAPFRGAPLLPPLCAPLPASATRSVSSSAAVADDTSDLARSISSALLKHAQTTSSSHADLPQHLSLHFSDVRFNTSLLLQVLNLSAPAGRAAADLFRWAVALRSFTPSDESLSHVVDFLGRRHDFRPVHDLLVEFRRAAGPKTLRAALDRLVRAGRPTQAVRFFEGMEQHYGMRRDRAALSTLVSALCEHGYAGHAERVVKQCANEIFPDDVICHELVRGWCVDGKLDETTRLMGEMARGGFELGTPSYNAVLDCVCRLCRKKDPLRMQSESNKVLEEMEARGVPRDADTFAVLVSNLCKIRRTEDALKLFRRMGEWGCSPNAETYLALVRSLFQAARVAEGYEMIEEMRQAGFGASLDRKAYYGFIKILCGIERVEHAVRVFRMAKGYGFTPGIKTYDLLIEKLWAHNQVSRANALFEEAVARGIAITQKAYKVDIRYMKKPKEKKKPKRLTLPEKMERKRKRLRKLRLSFVKKPKARRAY
ncbi:hypothetical protein Taro_012611 [Colocasia esculenta]|uniref:Pentatricopeptide repeat-containing protein PNM1, mitochondrial n=1 Tax=Colocasia esculenta TaxID=4460 RepID=A0A843U4D4_COLES|nr:hypothetical protein [Colocasia esculenta]